MMRHGYLASTSYADKLLGDVLAELDRLALAGNTIIVLWGDHGWNLGEHNFWGKHNTMHLATRVPLIVKAPGKKAGSTSSLVRRDGYKNEKAPARAQSGSRKTIGKRIVCINLLGC